MHKMTDTLKNLKSVIGGHKTACVFFKHKCFYSGNKQMIIWYKDNGNNGQVQKRTTVFAKA